MTKSHDALVKMDSMRCYTIQCMQAVYRLQL